MEEWNGMGLYERFFRKILDFSSQGWKPNQVIKLLEGKRDKREKDYAYRKHIGQWRCLTRSGSLGYSMTGTADHVTRIGFSNMVYGSPGKDFTDPGFHKYFYKRAKRLTQKLTGQEIPKQVAADILSLQLEEATERNPFRFSSFGKGAEDLQCGFSFRVVSAPIHMHNPGYSVYFDVLCPDLARKQG